jgi:hypothetical protein
MWNKLFLLHGTIGDFCLLLALCNMVLAKKKSVVFWKKTWHLLTGQMSVLFGLKYQKLLVARKL